MKLKVVCEVKDVVEVERGRGWFGDTSWNVYISGTTLKIDEYGRESSLRGVLIFIPSVAIERAKGVLKFTPRRDC